jgi:hypothetical protein
VVFTDEQLSRIQAAPAAIFALVAGADGGVSPAETGAWAAWRAGVDAAGGLSPDPAYDQVWEWLLTEAPAAELPQASRGALLDLIGEAGALLTRVDCPVTDGPAVKRALARLATEVAAAHRPWLFGESAHEEAALEAVLRRLR